MATEADLMRLTAALRRNCDYCRDAPATVGLCEVHRLWARGASLVLDRLVGLRAQHPESWEWDKGDGMERL